LACGLSSCHFCVQSFLLLQASAHALALLLVQALQLAPELKLMQLLELVLLERQS
jgi:hypothetical protein